MMLPLLFPSSRRILPTGAGALVIGIGTAYYFKLHTLSKDIFQAALSGDLELVKRHFILNPQCVHFKLTK
jgi:hypothetical protein